MKACPFRVVLVCLKQENSAAGIGVLRMDPYAMDWPSQTANSNFSELASVGGPDKGQQILQIIGIVWNTNTEPQGFTGWGEPYLNSRFCPETILQSYPVLPVMADEADLVEYGAEVFIFGIMKAREMC
jgi:hypothetical protein